MIRVFVLYEQEPDPERYEEHAELCRRVAGETFRHGKVFGAPMGEPKFPYYAEWEFPDRDAFEAAGARRSSRRPGRTRWRWGSRSTSTSPRSSERADDPDSARARGLGFERIVYEKAPRARRSRSTAPTC